MNDNPHEIQDALRPGPRQDGGDARRVNATRALLINSFGGVLLLIGVYLLKIQPTLARMALGL